MQQIKSIGVLQTSKTMGVVDFFIGVLIAIWFILHRLMRHGLHHPRLLVFFLFIPIIYGVGGFVITAISCWIYNRVARRTGGIEIDLAP